MIRERHTLARAHLLRVLWCGAALALLACGGEPSGDENQNQSPLPDGGVVALCGNGTVEGDEECDQGAQNDDYRPDTCRTQCTLPYCGDHVVDTGEHCDEGTANGYPGASCRRDCHPPVCGDGEVGGVEACDDGNLDSGDGCSPSCEVEDRWECVGSPSLCGCSGFYRGAQCTECVVLVDLDAAGEPADGERWSTAFRSPRRGLNVAADASQQTGLHCEVWVAEGVYFLFEGHFLNALQLHDNAALYGGFAGTESHRQQRDPVAHPTVLDGRDADPGTAQLFHVLKAQDVNDVMLDGLTVRGGRAIGWFNDAEGGGLWAVGVSGLHISGCRFEDNIASERGAGLFLGTCQAVVLAGNTFRENTSWVRGGGIFADSSEITSSSDDFIANVAGMGGGLYGDRSKITLQGPRFLDNRAVGISPSLIDGAGGGLYVGGSASTISIFDGLIAGNGAQGRGGGALLNLVSQTPAPTIQRTTFAGNGAYYGGALEVDGDGLEVSQCLFTGNVARHGAAVNLNQFTDTVIHTSAFLGNAAQPESNIPSTVELRDSLLSVTSTSFVGNRNVGALFELRTSELLVTNSLLWGDAANTTPDLDLDTGSSALVQWSLWPGGNCGVDGVLCAPPALVAGPLAPLDSGTFSEINVDPETRLTRIRVSSPQWAVDELRGKLVQLTFSYLNINIWLPIHGNDSDSLWFYGRPWIVGSYSNQFPDYLGEIALSLDHPDFAIFDGHLSSTSPAIDAANGTDLPAVDLEGNPRVDVSTHIDQYDCAGAPGCLTYGDLGGYEYQP